MWYEANSIIHWSNLWADAKTSCCGHVNDPEKYGIVTLMDSTSLFAGQLLLPVQHVGWLTQMLRYNCTYRLMATRMANLATWNANNAVVWDATLSWGTQPSYLRLHHYYISRSTLFLHFPFSAYLSFLSNRCFFFQFFLAYLPSSKVILCVYMSNMKCVCRLKLLTLRLLMTYIYICIYIYIWH